MNWFENSSIESQLFCIILAFLTFEFVLSQTLSRLNLKSWNQPLPSEVKDLMSDEEFKKAKEYAQANARFGVISSSFSFLILIGFLLLRGFAAVDHFARGISDSPIVQALIFFGTLAVASQLLGLPFKLYSTFVIEEKFGFNKTTAKTFIGDLLKGTLLGVILGGALLALLTYLFQVLGDYFWIVGWAITSGVSILLAMFFTSLLLPLFNKLTKLESGVLKESIEKFANRVQFPLSNIFIMDGSKRSSKANAFFSGIGSRRNIVLFDNLVNDLSTEEVTAVLAHEVGHYQMKHVLKGVILSIVQTGLLFLVFGWIARISGLGAILGAEANSFHLSVMVFFFLYAPLSMIIRLLSMVLSRKHEYEADAYAAKNDSGESLISALKKLSKNHLSHLQPHPAYVFFHYSHPTLLQRMRKLRSAV